MCDCACDNFFISLLVSERHVPDLSSKSERRSERFGKQGCRLPAPGRRTVSHEPNLCPQSSCGSRDRREEELNGSGRARVTNAWTSDDESSEASAITSRRPDQTLVYSRRRAARRDEEASEGGDVRQCLNDGQDLGSSARTLSSTADLCLEDLEALDCGEDENVC